MYLLIYFFSGLCLLTFEILWIHVFSVKIGSSAVSLSLVTSSFFIYTALGSIAGGQLLKKYRKKWLFGLSELLFVLATLTGYLLKDRLQIKIGPDILSKFIFVSSLTAVPFFFAGAGFPFLTEYFVPDLKKRIVSGGKFYMTNLIGASIGVLTGGFALPAMIGYNKAFFVTAVLDILTAVAALMFSNNIAAVEPVKEKEMDKDPGSRGYYGALVIFSSGALSICLEVLIIIYFQQMTMPSIYVTTLAFFTFILSLGLGASLAVYLRNKFSPETLIRNMLYVTGMLIIISGSAYYFFTTDQLFYNNPYLLLFFILPAVVPAGTIYPIGWEIFKKTGTGQGRIFGLIGFINKAGCAIGAISAGFLLVKYSGISGAFIITGAAYLLLGFLAKPSRSSFVMILILISTVLLIKNEPAFLNKNEKLLNIYSGASGIVTVTLDENNSHHIVLNQNYMLNGTEKALLSQKNQSWLPLVISRNTGTAAYIGMGSGISADACLDFPVKKFEVYEIVPEVKTAAKEGFSGWNSRLFSTPYCNIFAEDGRLGIFLSKEKYDVIISDLYTPQYEYTGYMYTEDFYRTLAGKINTGGIVCQWLPMYQLDDELAGIVIRTFGSVFPYAAALRGSFDPLQNTITLIGSKEPIDFSDKYLKEKLAGIKIKGSFFLKSPEHIKLSVCFDIRAAEPDFEKYPLNTDDNVIFTFKSYRKAGSGNVMRAYPFLYRYGNIMNDRKFVSLKLNSLENDKLSRAVRAGNMYFAASIENELLKTHGAGINAIKLKSYVDDALKIYPEAKLTADELGN